MNLMRKFLISVAIIGLVAGFPPAFAQDREHQDQPGPSHNERHGGEQRAGERRGGQPHQGGPQQAPAAQAGPERAGPPRGEMRGRDEGRFSRPQANTAIQPNQPSPNAPDNDRRGGERRFGPNNAMRGPAMELNQPQHAPTNAMRGPDRRFGPNNAMRGAPNRDFSGVRNFHQNFRAERRFHAMRYIRPRGFYERRWTWGETLPPLFWARQYWIIDFADYDLPPPPIGAIWVRVGDDALLIDQDSGFIIEVDYGVFY